MDLPATQAIDDDEIAPTQRTTTNDNNENEVIGTLSVGNQQHLIVSGLTTIGRHPKCSIIIDNETVSKRHAEIEAESIEGSLFIKDLGSCNKTKINNTKLRPYSSYQIKDGDKLIFGQVVTIFKIYSISDDSFITSTPQIKKKIQSFISEDSSLQNPSFTSESDIFAIPETQEDEIDTCSNNPEKSIKNNEFIKHTTTNIDHLSTYISKNKSKANEISTKILCLSDIKEDLKKNMSTSIISNSTSTKNCRDDLIENIYEMETQRPFDHNENENDIENVQTQKFNLNKSAADKNKSMHCSNTDKLNFEAPPNDSLTNFFEEQFKVELNDSISNLATQKLQTPLSNSISNFRTQELQTPLSDSISNLATQKLQTTFSDSISNLATQKLQTPLSDSISNLPTQKLQTALSDSISNLATQKLQTTFSDSISNLATQKLQTPLSDSISNLLTQKLDYKFDFDQETLNISTYSAPKQQIISESSSNVYLKNFETVNCGESLCNTRKSENILNSSVKVNKIETEVLTLNNKRDEMHNFNSNKEKLINEQELSIYTADTQRIVPELVIDKCINNLETENFHNMKYNITSPNLYKRKSNLDKKKYNGQLLYDDTINEDIKEDSKTISNLEFSIEEKIHLGNKQNTLNNDYKDSDTQLQKEVLHEPLLNTSLSEVKTSLNLNNFNETDKQKKDSNISESDGFSSTDNQFDKSKRLLNVDQINYTSDNDEDEMFYSQNLIQDCPFSFHSEESQIDNQLNHNTENLLKAKEHENESITEKKFNVSINKNKYLNKNEEKADINLSLYNECLLNESLINKNRFSKIDVQSESYEKDKTKKFNKRNSLNNINVINEKNQSDSETDEEGIFYSSYLLKNMNENLNKNYDSNNKIKLFRKNSSLEQNNLMLESSSVDSEGSMFEDCDNENKYSNLVIKNSLCISNSEQTINEKTNENMISTAVEIKSVSKSLDNKHERPDSLIKTPTSNGNKNVYSKIKAAELFINSESELTQKPICTKQCLIDNYLNKKKIEKSKNDTFQTLIHHEIKEIKPKLLSEDVNIEITNHRNINSSESSNKKTENIEQNLDEMFDRDQAKTIEQQPALLTNQLTDILESTQIENNLNPPLSPTLDYRKNNIKKKSRHKAMVDDHCEAMSPKTKTLSNLNDTIERDLNEIFENNINSVENYELDGMLTQQLKSALQSQDDSQSNNEENIKKIPSPSLSVDTEKKRRLNLLMNLNNSMASQDHIDKEKFIDLDLQLKLDLDKEKSTLRKSNINNDSQDSEAYFENLKFKRKNNIPIDSEEENDEAIVIKEENTSFSNIDNVKNIKESAVFLEYKSSDSQSSYGKSTDNIQDTFKVHKKRISLSLPKGLNLNLSQTIRNDQEVERKISTEEGGHKASVMRLQSINEQDHVDKNTDNSPASRRSPLDKVCTSSNTNLFINETATDDCTTNSDDDFLKSMPAIKVAGGVDCPATNSQLAAPSDDDYFDEETAPIPISPTDIVVPIKWNWYAKRRFDLIYRKDRSGPKVVINNKTVSDSTTLAQTRVSRINNILAKIESVGKENKSCKSNDRRRRAINNEEKINTHTTRSRRVSKSTLTERFQYNSSSSSDSDSDSIFQRIFPKYNALEPMEIDKHECEIDDSDEEFRLLKKRCEKMLAAPSAYSNLAMRNKNLKANSRPVIKKKNNCGSLRPVCDYDADCIHSLRERSDDKVRTVDEDGLVFQMSAADMKVKVPDIGSSRNNKRLLEAKRKRSANRESNRRGSLKTQEPLKFQETVGIATTRAKRSLTFQRGPPKRRGGEIENDSGPSTIQNCNILGNKKAKVDNKIGCDIKENQYNGYWNADGTASHSRLKTSIPQNNETDSLSPASVNNNSNFKMSKINGRKQNLRATQSRITRQNRNKNKSNDLVEKYIGKQESDYEKLKDVQDISKERINNNRKTDNQNLLKCEQLKDIVTKVSKGERKQNITSTNVENVEVTNHYRTRSTKAKVVKSSTLKIMENKNAVIKTKIQNLPSNEVVNTRHAKTRNKRIKDKDSDTNEIIFDIGNETKNESGRTSNLLSNKPVAKDDNEEPKIAIDYINMNPFYKRTRKRVVNSAEESQKVTDSLHNIKDKDLKIMETRSSKRISKNIENSKDVSNKSVLNVVSEKSAKRRRPNRSVERKSIPDTSKILKEDLFQKLSTSRKQNIATTSVSSVTSILVPSTTRSMSTSHVKPLYKILFTGDKSKIYKEIKNLGAFVTEDPTECSILVTDKIQKTFKFLYSLAQGIPIVSFKWLEDSNKANVFLNWENYILNDKVTESRLKFTLIESLNKAKKMKFLKGYTLILTPNITHLPILQLKEIVICSGGKCLLRPPRNWNEKTIVIAQTNNIQQAKKIVMKAPISLTVHSTEFILTGILRQEINLEEFKLLV